MPRIARRIAAVVAIVAIVLFTPIALASPAHAHVTANPNEATSPFFRTALRVGHGCEGSPTTSVRVKIPEGIENARAEVIPGWKAEVVREKLDQPVATEEGEEITDRVAEIVWSGGRLSDDNFQEYGLSLRIAEDAPEVLWLPTIQKCEKGEHRWIEIPDSIEQWNDLEEPAPYIKVAIDEDEGDGEATANADAAAASGPEAADFNIATALSIAALVAALLALAIAAGILIRGRRRA